MMSGETVDREEALTELLLYSTGVAAAKMMPKGKVGVTSGKETVAQTKPAPNIGGGRKFSHFTNEKGLKGITGVDPSTLRVGETITINKLSFGTGKNKFMAGKRGDIFVTELGGNATKGQLNQIGVFGNKQKYVIQFSEETAFNQGVRVAGQNASRSIFTIPGDTSMEGIFIIKRIR